MEAYFNDVVTSLTSEDACLLSVLVDADATVTFKAVPYKEAMEKGRLTEAILRKSIARLTALRFISLRTDSKEHGVCITAYGQAAIQKILLEVVK